MVDVFVHTITTPVFLIANNKGKREERASLSVQKSDNKVLRANLLKKEKKGSTVLFTDEYSCLNKF